MLQFTRVLSNYAIGRESSEAERRRLHTASAPKERILDLDKLLADLTKEKDRLGRAIEALGGIGHARPRQEAPRPAQGLHNENQAEETQARRPHARRQEAIVDCNEEALGRAQEEKFVAKRAHSPMRPILLVMAIFTLAGCSGIQQDVTHLQQEQDAISAATKKIKVVSGAIVNGHPQYAKLGPAAGLLLEPAKYDRWTAGPRRLVESVGVSQVWRPGRCDREHDRMVRRG